MEAKTLREKFAEWYRLLTGNKLPGYLPNDVKKILVAKFEAATGLKYTN